MRKVLGEEFFERKAPVVAKELLGKYLVRQIGSETVALMIHETEAYDGFEDKASHAHRGATPRNSVMFGKSGRMYVHFTYGMHWMLNLVCGKEGYPSGVLIRGAGDISGPARLTKALSIDKKLNTLPLSKKSGLWVEDRGVKVSKKEITLTPRVGIRYAEEWIEKPWRFVLTQKNPLK
jgi:DNA-3-methyladenine glycosylase